jgi:hypothetical protein
MEGGRSAQGDSESIDLLREYMHKGTVNNHDSLKVPSYEIGSGHA